MRYVFISVTRVRSQGKVYVTFNVITKDFHSYNLDNSQRPITTSGALASDFANMNLS